MDDFAEVLASFCEQLIEGNVEDCFGSILVMANMQARMVKEGDNAHSDIVSSCQIKLGKEIAVILQHIIEKRAITAVADDIDSSGPSATSISPPKTDPGKKESAQERRAKLIELNKQHKLEQQRKMQMEQDRQLFSLKAQKEREAGDSSRLERVSQLSRLMESLYTIALPDAVAAISELRKAVVTGFACLVCAGLDERYQLIVDELESHRTLQRNQQEKTVEASDDDPYLKALSAILVYADPLIEKLLLGEYAVVAGDDATENTSNSLVTYAIAKDVESKTSRVVVKILESLYEDKQIDMWIGSVNEAEQFQRQNSLEDLDIPWDRVSSMDQVLNDLMEAQQYCGHFTRFLSSLKILDGDFIHQGAISTQQLRLASAYIVLETAWISLSLTKARDIAEVSGEDPDQVNSIVENTFYVVRKAFARAVHTESSEAAAATANHIHRLLEDSYSKSMRLFLDKGSINPLLARAGSEGESESDMFNAAFDSALHGAGSLHSGLLVAINSVDLSATLMQNFTQEVQGQFEARFPEKLRFVEMAIGGLGQTAELHDSWCAHAIGSIVGSCLSPRVNVGVRDYISDITYNLNHARFEKYEREDPFVSKFIKSHVLEERNFIKCCKSLAPRNFIGVIRGITDVIASSVEQELMKQLFNELGALRLDHDIRALVSCLGSITQESSGFQDDDDFTFEPEHLELKESIRASFARLFQFSFLVGLESTNLVELIPYPNAPVLDREMVIAILNLRVPPQPGVIVEQLDISKQVI